jgi:hypothetical protein
MEEKGSITRGKRKVCRIGEEHDEAEGPTVRDRAEFTSEK